ncbi:hypothetical protein DQ392_11165 [Streptomyces reniochalinae]|uniref:TPM domain-containing protein n=1 Tax=Streptomyces reniochalinae TaxID=2250578 RepID=A0A367ENQ7_9ACTN|nr:hypothetical protein DQ392_11165 [Streptomyces reniochalinae]
MRGGGVAAVAAALLLVWGAVAPARAAGSPGAKIAEALRTSPVYVDPAYAQAFPAGKQHKLERRIEASGLPVRVIVVPFVTGDAWDADPRKMIDVVRDRLGESPREEAVYMTLSGTDGFLEGREYPRDGPHQANWGVAAVGHQEDMDGKSLYAKFSRALEIVEAGNGDEVYEKATADLSEGPAVEGAEGGTSWLLPTLSAAGALTALAAAVLVVRAVRRGGAARGAFTSPRSVFASARKAGVGDLRRRAERELLAYNEELLARDPGEEGADSALLQLSLDAYDAAAAVLDTARGIPDLAGVLALVHEGRGALRGPAPERGKRGRGRKGRRPGGGAALPLCFFHPLHGPATGRIRWRPLGRREALHVAACGTCAAAVAAHRTPEVLTQTHEGRTVPYFEVPAEESLWAATGYGSLGETTLTARVRRGDFSRTRG